MSGDGDWLIYNEGNASTSRTYSFSRVTRVKHLLGGFKGEFSLSDDGQIASLHFGHFVDARTGKRRGEGEGFPANAPYPYPSPKYFNGASHGGTPLSADGKTAAVGCRTGVFIVDLATGQYSRVTKVPVPQGADERSVNGLTITAEGSALVFASARGLFKVSTAGATPVDGVPGECLSDRPT